MVRPDPIKAIVPRRLLRSGGTEAALRRGRVSPRRWRGPFRRSTGGPVKTPSKSAICGAAYRDGVDDAERDIRSLRHGLEQALAHIFTEQLPRQEGVGEGLMQTGLVLALIELAKAQFRKSPGWPARMERSRVRTLSRCKG